MGRETSTCGCLSHAPYWAHNPGMCPDWKSNLNPLVRSPALSPLSYTGWGRKWVFLMRMESVCPPVHPLQVPTDQPPPLPYVLSPPVREWGRPGLWV